MGDDGSAVEDSEPRDAYLKKRKKFKKLPKSMKDPPTVGNDKASDARVEDKSMVAAELRYQIEFYFSEANLRRDAYLKSLLSTADGLQGWCSLSEILRFNKAARLVADLRGEAKLSFAESCLQVSEVVEVDSGKIRRKAPAMLQDSSLGLRTVYAEPIGEASQEDVRTKFETIGPVNLVRVVKNRGFAFVEYQSIDDAQTASAALHLRHLFSDDTLTKVITHVEWHDMRQRWNQLVQHIRKVRKQPTLQSRECAEIAPSPSPSPSCAHNTK